MPTLDEILEQVRTLRDRRLDQKLRAARFHYLRAKKCGVKRVVKNLIHTKFPYALPLPRLSYVIAIEVTNHCNLKCIMCPSPALTGPRGFMSMELYEKILKQAIAGGTLRFRFIGLGESLMHPELPEFLRMAKRGGINTEITTNAAMLTPKLGAALLDAGLDEIAFSLDSADPVEYERVRKGAKFGKVMSNVDAFLDMCASMGARAPVTIARMVVLDEAGRRAFLDRWSHKVDLVQFSELRVYEGTEIANGGPQALGPNRRLPLVDAVDDTRRASVSRLVDPRARCRQLLDYMLINWNGGVGLCAQASVVVGDARTTPLAEIWRGPVMEKVRALHRAYQGQRIDVCKGCPIMLPAGAMRDVPADMAAVTVRRPWSDDMVA